MRSLIVIACGLVLLSAIGCKSEVTEADAQRVNKEFSKENYEKAMKEAGRGKELEEEKAREAAYKAQGGGSSDQDAGQH